MDTNGNIYVSEMIGHVIRKITAGGAVTILAGSSSPGSVDGNGAAARFRNPRAVAVDAAGYIYVADTSNHKIRKITPAGAVTTLAGSGIPGGTDGIGTAATFDTPTGIAVDPNGNVYVGAQNNNKIRKITPTGVVSTFAGSDSSGSIDGTSEAARFHVPGSVATDTTGNLYVAEVISGRIRKITPAGVVTTLAGSGSAGNYDGIGSLASFNYSSGVAVDSSGSVYVADSSNHKIRKGVSPLAQTISFPSIGDKMFGDAPFSVSASASSGLPVTYAIVSGSATISGNTITLTGGGNVTVRVFQNGNPNYEAAQPVDQSFNVSKITQMINFSALPGKSFGDAAFSLTAISTSGLPVSFSLVGGPATVAGSTVTLTGAGSVTVRASQPGNAIYAAAASVNQSFVTIKGNQVITFPALSGRVFGDIPFTISASASSALPISFSIVSGPASISGNIITLNNTGTIVVRASQTGSVNYEAASAIDQSFLVKTSQNITLNALLGRTYGDAPFSVTASASSGLPVVFSIVSGPAILSGNIITLTGHGTVLVRVSQAGNSTYASVTRDESFIVAKPPQTINFFAPAGKTYGDAPFVINSSASSGLPVSLFIISGPATISGNSVTMTAAGTVLVRATQVGDATYAAATPVEQSFTVAKASQSITFPVIANRMFGAGNVTLAATASTGLPIGYSVVSGSATLSGTTLTISGAGTIFVKASQAGNANYLAAPDVSVSFTVLPNTAAPSAITLSKNWLYDNASLNTEIGTFSATDPDAGDLITYSLVTGTGSTDNAKFVVSGNILRTASAAFNYDTQRTASIRIRATDLAGQFIEQVITLLLIDGTPSALIIKKQVIPQTPAFVNVIFQLVDSQGYGINYPRTFIDSNPNLFLIEEQNSNGNFVSIGSESFAQVGKFDEIPSETKTVILIDASDSALDPILQNAVKAGVRALIERKIPRKQKISIYAFAETLTLLQDFSDDANLLNDALNRIPTTGGSTDLYGAIISTLPRWSERFELTGIETGSMIVFTDGAHTFDAKTPDSVVNAAAATSSSPAKQIYAVGLRSPDLDVNALRQISTPSRYFEATDTTQLVSKFELVQSRIEDQANSIYWMNYYTAKRAGTAQVRIKLSGNSPATNWLDVSFNAVGFSTPARKIIVNRRVDKVDGEIDFEFGTNGLGVADLLSFRGIPPSALTAVVDDPELVDVVRISATRFELRGKGLNGTTTLTVSDSAASLVPARRLPVKVGTGIALPSQNIIFIALPDRVPTSPAFTISASASSLLPVTFSLISGPATVSGNTVTLTGLVGTVTIRANQAGNASFAAANPETRSFTVASSGVLLTHWASSSGLSGPNTAPTATPFNDGVENLLKYAFNMNAAGPDVRVLAATGSSGLPQIAVDTSGAEPVLKVAFLRRKGSGLIYTPQRSNTLGNFQSMTGTQTVTSIDSQWERVTVQEPAPLATAPSAFARVQVSLP